MKKIVFIGSVDSSDLALKTLIEEKVNISLVLSLNPDRAANVSDYCPIHKTAQAYNIPYLLFDNINDKDVVKTVQGIVPDFIFVVGLSQIIKQDLMSAAKDFVVGFHPTAIPHNRGRAALPWQILLGEKESSITFFKIDQGMDSGDVLFREPYFIDEMDYVSDVYAKVLDAMALSLKKNIHKLMDDQILPEKQDETNASYLLIRRPYDGIIDWGKPTDYILRVIRATSHPYPGAYAYLRNKKITIFRAEKHQLLQSYIGYNGQVAEITPEGKLIVLTQDGSIKVTEYSVEENAVVYVGSRLIGEYDPGIHM